MFPRYLAILALTLTPLTTDAQDGWLLFRGNPARTGTAAGVRAWKDMIAWQRPLLMDKTEGFNNADPDERAKALIEKLRKDADPSILPGFFPIIVNDLCIYHSHRDVRCVALRNFLVKEDVDRFVTVKPGEINYKTLQHDTALATLLETNKTRDSFARMVAAFQEEKRDYLLWANPMIGSLSSDGKVVYLVKDMVFPTLKPMQKPIDALPFFKTIGELRPFLRGNELHAYDAFSGKRLWDTRADDRAGPFGASFTLGAPLSHDGMLHLLNEKDDVLRLVKLSGDPAKIGINGDNPPIEKLLPLLKVPLNEQILHSPLRRTQPLHIAHDATLLVCPTHAGVIVGVDRVGMEVRWSHRYRDEKTAAPTHPHWQAACPVILKDRIVFTAADAPDVHCIGMDGAKKWTAPADKDLYLGAAHDNIVMLVGKTHCRGLSLADGSEKWKIETGLPAGVGVLDGSTYYLPLKRDGGTIWGIDLAKGKHAATVKVAHPDALGNLALHRGMFVSQSVTHIAAFPLAK